MTREERADIESRLESILHRKIGFFGDMSAGDFAGIPIIAGILFAGLGWFLGFLGWVVGLFPVKSTATTIGLIAGLALAAAITVTSAIRAAIRARRLAASSPIVLQHQLDDGRMEELHCDVEKAVKLEEYEDEGHGYFLQVQKGVILFLRGQHLAEMKPFPAERITMTRPAGDKFWGYPTTQGKRVRPVRVIKTLPLKQRYRALKAMFFRGDIDTIEQDVLRLTGKEPDLLEEILGEGSNRS